MAEIIPEEKILEIRNAVDIVDVVSEVVRLKKAGRNFVGLCPFHNEKTPSFTVSAEKQIFYCFGCGAGGNLFRFLMKRDGMSFPEAVRAMARRAGIDLPRPHLTPAQRQQQGERDQLLAANRMATDFYARTLSGAKAGEKARAYLRARGMGREIIEEFRIGYAPGGWDTLLRALGAQRVAPQVLEKAGLVVARSRGSGFYDRFRERIIFPICNLSRQVIGFGGRVMDDSLPKYLNSPETPVYSKGQTLYGYNLARPACRQSGEIFVVEGYFDLLALFQGGIRNAVATLGTALTETHVRMLKGVARTVLLVFDSDAAGMKAATRGGELFIREAVDARVVVLPAGHDPDSFLAREGADAFRAVAGRASGIFPFLIETAMARNGSGIEARIRVVDELLPLLAGVEDQVARSLYVKELAERVGVDELPLLEKVRGAAGRTKKNQATASSAAGAQVPESNAMGHGAHGSRYRLEQQIVAMMLQFPEILPEVDARGTLAHFEDDDLRAVGLALLAGSRVAVKTGGGEAAADLVDRIADERLQLLAARLAIGEDPWDRNGCLRLLEQYEISRRRRVDPVLDQIRAAEESGDNQRLMELLRNVQDRVTGNH